MTRDEVISEIRDARREWNRAVRRLPTLDRTTFQVTGAWDIKDVVGHLATYIRLNARHVESYLKRGKITSMRARNWYQFNKREAARLKKTPLPKLRKDLDSAYFDLLALVRKLSDEDLNAKFPSPWSKDSTRHVRLATILRADVSRHFREHTRDLKRKLDENRRTAPRRRSLRSTSRRTSRRGVRTHS